MSWRSRTYDELPALSVRGPDLRRSLRIVTIAWMYGVVWNACITAANVQAFNRMVGFTDFDFGLMTAIPFLATFSQLIATVLLERIGLRKYQFMYFGVIQRMLWIPVGMVPLVLPAHSGIAVTMVLLLVGASWFSESLARPAWLTWMSNLVPRRIRGRYFAQRSRRAMAVQIGVVVVLALLVDHNWQIWQFLRSALHLEFDDGLGTQERLLKYTLCGIYIVAGLFGMVDILLFTSIRDIIPRKEESPAAGLTFRSLLIDPMRDRVFRHYVGYNATMVFVSALTGVYAWLFVQEDLRFSQLGANILFLVFGPLAYMASSLIWGKLIDRWGRRPVLILATVVLACSAAPIMFAMRAMPYPHFIETACNWLAQQAGTLTGHDDWRLLSHNDPVSAYMLVALCSIISYAGLCGFDLANTGILLGFGDSQRRRTYIAVSTVFISVGGILGGLAGGTITQLLQKMPPIGPFLWNNLQVCFLASIAIRLAALFWLRGMPDPGADSVGAMLGQMRSNFINVLLSRLSYPLRLFGGDRQAKRESPGNKRRR